MITAPFDETGETPLSDTKWFNTIKKRDEHDEHEVPIHLFHNLVNQVPSLACSKSFTIRVLMFA